MNSLVDHWKGPYLGDVRILGHMWLKIQASFELRFSEQYYFLAGQFARNWIEHADSFFNNMS